jgi:hypothetical protein
VADGAQTLGDRLALAGEAPVLVARCCDILRALSYTRCPLWGATRAALCRLAVGVGAVLVHLFARLFCLRGSLGSGPLFGRQRSRDRLPPFMRPMEEVRGVRRSKVVLTIRHWVSRFVLSARIYAGFRAQFLEKYDFSNMYTQSS